MKTDYDSSGIEIYYFLIRALIEPIKTDYILIGFNRPFSAGFLRVSWNFLTKSEKYCASWLNTYRYGLQWKDRMIPYSTAKRLITMAAIGAEEGDD